MNNNNEEEVEVKVFTCKSCIYSKIPLITRIKRAFQFKTVESSNMVCKRFYLVEVPGKNNIIGFAYKRVSNVACITARKKRVVCGLEAKYWKPKDAKDLFKLLTKE